MLYCVRGRQKAEWVKRRSTGRKEEFAKLAQKTLQSLHCLLLGKSDGEWERHSEKQQRN